MLPGSHTAQEPLLRSVNRLLRPLVRLLIRRGVTFPALAEMLRALYVDVARRDLLPDPAARTDSRVSLITGVHRKELRRIRNLPEGGEFPVLASLGSQVVARWLGRERYAAPDGTPLALPRGGDAPSFETLVAEVTSDVRARTVLDELLASGTVSLDEAGRVRLLTSGIVPRPGQEEQLFHLGRNLHDHVAASAANVEAGEAAPFLERSVHYDGLPPEVASALEAEAQRLATELLLAVNRRALTLLEAHGEAAPGRPTRRVNLGVYLYAEAETPATRGTETAA